MIMIMIIDKNNDNNNEGLGHFAATTLPWPFRCSLLAAFHFVEGLFCRKLSRRRYSHHFNIFALTTTKNEKNALLLYWLCKHCGNEK